MKRRIISAVIGVPVLLWILLAAPDWGVWLLVTVLSEIAAYELLVNTKLVDRKPMQIFSYATSLIMSWWCCFEHSEDVFPLILLLLLILLFADKINSGGKATLRSIGCCMAAGMLLPYIYSILFCLAYSEKGRIVVLIPLIIAFLSDTGAYFTGLALGKHHFAPDISPNKTIEGVFGGIILAVIGMVGYSIVVNACSTTVRASIGLSVLYGVLGSLAATFGDLCFSSIKREVGIKDFGNLIPGHGGILDRFDSMTIVLLLTQVLMCYLPVLQAI